MIGVALEGGGARGSYQVGAITALKKCGIKPSCYVGTSIGAVNAALASTGNLIQMKKIWNSMNSEELFNIDSNLIKAFNEKTMNKKQIKQSIQTVFGIIKNAGIDTKKLRETYKKYIDETAVRNSSIDFGLVTYSLTDKKAVELFKKDIPKGKLSEYLIASCYLPVFKMEKIIDNKYYLDGGFHDNCPINMLLEKDYDEIYAIRTNSLGIKKKLIKNDANIIYITPKKNLGSVLLFDHQKLNKNFNLGYFDTLKIVKKLDGKDYYFKNKDLSYYKKITKHITNKDVSIKDNINEKEKEITLKILERVCIKYEINKYSVYNITFLIIKLKYIMKKDINNKDYNFIKNLKISF